jgi:hypothetical protein
LCSASARKPLATSSAPANAQQHRRAVSVRRMSSNRSSRPPRPASTPSPRGSRRARPTGRLVYHRRAACQSGAGARAGTPTVDRSNRSEARSGRRVRG